MFKLLEKKCADPNATLTERIHCSISLSSGSFCMNDLKHIGLKLGDCLNKILVQSLGTHSVRAVLDIDEDLVVDELVE